MCFSLLICFLQALKDVEMEHLGARSADSVRRLPSSRHSYRSRSHKRRLGQEPITPRTAEKVRKKQKEEPQYDVVFNKCVVFILCTWRGFKWDDSCRMLLFIHILCNLCVYFFFYSFLFFSHHQHPSTINESLSTCEHELVSRSLTIATLPLLVLTRRRSHSLTNDISDAAWGKGRARSRLASRRSDSFDSLNLGRASLKVSSSPQTVPRIIVISPTTESDFNNRENNCGEESLKALEDNVFVSSSFSSEVFEAVELLTWQPEWRLFLSNTANLFICNCSQTHVGLLIDAQSVFFKHGPRIPWIPLSQEAFFIGMNTTEGMCGWYIGTLSELVGQQVQFGKVT